MFGERSAYTCMSVVVVVALAFTSKISAVEPDVIFCDPGNGPCSCDDDLLPKGSTLEIGQNPGILGYATASNNSGIADMEKGAEYFPDLGGSSMTSTRLSH